MAFKAPAVGDIFRLQNQNDGSETWLDLQNGDYQPFIQAIGASQATGWNYLRQCWVVLGPPSKERQGTLRFRNLISGTMLDQSGFKNIPGIQIMGYFANSTPAQDWILENPDSTKPDIYTLRNWGANLNVTDPKDYSYMTLGRDTKNPTFVQGWPSDGKPDMLWKFVRQSRLSDEIVSLLEKSPPLNHDVQSYLSPQKASYLILPDSIVSLIYATAKSNFKRDAVQPIVYGADSFALVVKTQVANEVASHCPRTNEIAPLFGLSFGTKASDKGPQLFAYNWYLKIGSAADSIAFFDPTTGNEIGNAGDLTNKVSIF